MSNKVVAIDHAVAVVVHAVAAVLAAQAAAPPAHDGSGTEVSQSVAPSPLSSKHMRPPPRHRHHRTRRRIDQADEVGESIMPLPSSSTPLAQSSPPKPPPTATASAAGSTKRPIGSSHDSHCRRRRRRWCGHIETATGDRRRRHRHRRPGWILRSGIETVEPAVAVVVGEVYSPGRRRRPHSSGALRSRRRRSRPGIVVVVRLVVADPSPVGRASGTPGGRAARVVAVDGFAVVVNRVGPHLFAGTHRIRAVDRAVAVVVEVWCSPVAVA